MWTAGGVSACTHTDGHTHNIKLWGPDKMSPTQKCPHGHLVSCISKVSVNSQHTHTHAHILQLASTEWETIIKGKGCGWDGLINQCLPLWVSGKEKLELILGSFLKVTNVEDRGAVCSTDSCITFFLPPPTSPNKSGKLSKMEHIFYLSLVFLAELHYT